MSGGAKDAGEDAKVPKAPGEAQAWIHVTCEEKELNFIYSFRSGQVEQEKHMMDLDVARFLSGSETWNDTDKVFTSTVSLIEDEDEALKWFGMKTVFLAQYLDLVLDFKKYVTLHNMLAEAICIKKELADERVRNYLLMKFNTIESRGT